MLGRGRGTGSRQESLPEEVLCDLGFRVKVRKPEGAACSQGSEGNGVKCAGSFPGQPGSTPGLLSPYELCDLGELFDLSRELSDLESCVSVSSNT